jgi:uncharacterized protein
VKLIGIEEHFLTDKIHRAWNAIGLDAVDPSMAFHSGTFEVRLLDLAEDRLALMDETGLDVQVLSLTTPMLHDLGPESLDLARRRGRDSNPRNACALNGFRDRPDRPLRHLSR